MNKKSIIDNPAISNIVFYPRKVPIPDDLESNIEPLIFEIGSNIKIGGYFFINESSLPNILLFHGNGEVALDYHYFAPMFFNCEVNLAVIDFRGYGHSNDQPYYTSLISDAIPLYNQFQKWLNNKRFNSTTFVFGRSLGSICAAEIGSKPQNNLKGIIFESGFASAYNVMTHLFRVNSPKITPEYLKQYSNDTRIQKFIYPTLIIHGTTDWIIPSSEAELIYKSLPDNIEKNLILIDGAGHNNILTFTKEYFDPLCRFIEKYK